jgi:hypothetical protein
MERRPPKVKAWSRLAGPPVKQPEKKRENSLKPLIRRETLIWETEGNGKRAARREARIGKSLMIGPS